MSTIPQWAQILGSLATPAIAAGVAYVAWRQWRTAREKLVLDLFEKRVAIYEKVLEGVRKVMGPGHPEDNEPFRLLHSARAEAEFLFGPEVPDYIRRLITDFANLRLAHTMMEAQRNGQPSDGQDYPQLSHDAILRVADAEKDISDLLRPYMSMDQTVPGRRRRRLPKQGA